jgi:riboflavin kinase / FMN adenylyltransferase
MIRIGNDLQPPRSIGRPLATIGTFDGVHKGHQRVLRDLRRWADSLGTTALVVTFDRAPRIVTRGRPVPCITSLDHKLVLFKRLGIDACAVLPFDRALRNVSAREFVSEWLCARLKVQGVLLGFNGRFGRNAEGDYDLLRQLQAEGVCKARRSRPVSAGGRTISSSAIREAIETGDLRAARQMLGRPVAVLGTVVRGKGRGAKLGFPTANLDLHHEVRPPAGVYITTARFARAWRPALTSIGPNPTFAPEATEDRIEVYIPGLRRELYGRALEVRFTRKLRDQIRFDNPGDLVAQMERDRTALKRAMR